MDYQTQQAVDRISNEDDQRTIRHALEMQDASFYLMRDELSYLRSQVANAITSLKFDLHPELPR